MNIKEIIENLIFKFPPLKPFISNVLSAEIRDRTLILTYPDFLKSFEEIENINNQIDEYLWDIKGIRLEYNFKNYKMPHLPYPAVSSKFSSKILFLKITDVNLTYTIVDKRKLYDFFNSGEKYHPFIIHKVRFNSKIKIFDLIEEILVDTIPILRDEFKYLHPIIKINNIESFFYFDILFKNIFDFIENSKKIKDLKRFIGVPCFSFIDYFNFFGVDNDS